MTILGLFRRSASPSRLEGGTPPRTYREWSAWFDRFERGGEDDALFDLARDGRVNWNSGTAAVFSERAAAALQERMEAVRAMLQKGIGRGGHERDVASAVMNARQAYSRLSNYADLPCWPHPLPSQLADMMHRTTVAIQESLLATSKSDRTGRLAKVLRDNPLDRYAPPPVAGTPNHQAPLPQVRRILL